MKIGWVQWAVILALPIVPTQAGAPGEQSSRAEAVALASSSSPGLPMGQAPGEVILARVELAGPPESFPLPVHACLQGGTGRDYLLVFATEEQLRQAGWPWRLVAKGCRPEELLLATELRAGARQAAETVWQPLLDDGRRWLLRATEEQGEQLSELGFALQRLEAEPVRWGAALPGRQDDGPGLTMPDPLVAAMVGAVQTTNLYSLVARLSGQETALAGGSPVLVGTRHTTSGLALSNALEASFSRLQALGLGPSYHAWTSGSYSGRNLVANLPGATLPNELVLLTAHLDDMPTGPTAPGADDNASGSAAVLLAAGICAQFQFERSIRFVLFTGEEQGLLGSARYAAAVQAAGENVVGVLNLDMLGWDGVAPPRFQLHTRSTAALGFTNDLAMAATFTNAVAAYGLSGSLMPVVKADALNASDHASFWNRGYPAILACEDYGTDVNPFYHTTGDTLAAINLGYFTAAAKGAVATVAHLAGPVKQNATDALELTTGDWNPGGIGARAFVARHLPEATETGRDPYDLAAADAPPNPRSAWFDLSSYPYGAELVMDSRPGDSESVFVARMALVTTNSITSNSKLRVDFLSPPAPDRLYLARIRTVFPLPDGFLCVTNLRDVANRGGHVALPPLTNVSGMDYGSCEIVPRFLDTSAAACPLRVVSAGASNIVLSTQAQVGVCIVDRVEFTTNLSSHLWSLASAVTNDVLPEPANFDVGWHPLTRSVDPASLPPAPQYFFRLKRTWLAP